jgi:Flp pilus assembly protein TadD
VQAASNLGVLYTTLGRYDDAVEIFERLVAAEPSQPTLRFNLALAYQGKGQTEKAEAELREVIELEPPGSPRAERARREMASVS